MWDNATRQCSEHSYSAGWIRRGHGKNAASRVIGRAAEGAAASRLTVEIPASEKDCQIDGKRARDSHPAKTTSAKPARIPSHPEREVRMPVHLSTACSNPQQSIDDPGRETGRLAAMRSVRDIARSCFVPRCFPLFSSHS